MSADNWTALGSIVGVISLIINIIQLRTNNILKKKVNSYKQVVGDGSSANQQTHSGQGDNISAGRDIKKN